MLTTGTVWANIQNKHSAPVICSLSGDSLFKLFRATGDVRYLRLIQQIAHAIPQYMSRPDRLICDRRPGQRWPIMPPGWINERVTNSDWEMRGNPDGDIGVGAIFGGSTWSEVAMMLTWAEVPGIYLQTDTGFLAVCDHVEACVLEARGQSARIEIHNQTAFDACVKVCAETSRDVARPLGPIAGHDFERVQVSAGQCVQLEIAAR